MFKLVSLLCSISICFASNECLTVKDSLDREYCFKKSLRSEELKLTKQISQIKKNLSKAKKAEVISSLDEQLEVYQEETKYLLRRQELIKAHKAEVTKLAITEVKKKKKKKNKLKNSLKKFGIKL